MKYEDIKPGMKVVLIKDPAECSIEDPLYFKGAVLTVKELKPNGCCPKFSLVEDSSLGEFGSWYLNADVVVPFEEEEEKQDEDKFMIERDFRNEGEDNLRLDR